MSERKRILNLILIMAMSAAIVAGVTITMLYRAAFNEEQARLVETAQSQARLIEAVARFDKKYSKDYPEGWEAATLSQINDAHEHYEGFGETGEFTLSKKEADNIVFLLNHRHFDLKRPKPVSFNSKLAEPMRQALLGHSGTLVGIDYRGEVVLAAHEPVSELDLGIVAKIDLSEIRAPFVKATLIAGFFSVLVILCGAALFIRVSNPIIRLLETRNIDLSKSNKRLNEEINERKQTEKALQESEQKYRQLVEHLQEGVWAIDKDANTTYVNPRMAEMIGYTVDEMIGKHLFSFMDKRGIEISKRNIERRKHGIKEQHDFELLHKNGRRVYTSMETAPITDGDENYIGALACVADITERRRAEEELGKLNLELEERVRRRTSQLQQEITERKQAEEKLRKNKDMLQMVFDGISDPLVMLGKSLEICLLNNSAADYYHVEPKEAVGKPCHQAFRGLTAKCENCEIPSAVLNDQPVVVEREGFMDSSRIEQIVVYPIEKEDEEGAAIIRISDITDEKMLQRRMVQTEKLSSIGFLVSGVAHEINNPNNFISFNIPILKEYLNELILIIDDYANEHKNYELLGMSYPEFRKDIFKLVDNIENGSRRINIVVSNLREMSRPKTGVETDWTDIKEVIEKSVSICRSKINRLVKSFEVDIVEDMPLIYTDSETIELVVINLLINAAQAADKENSWIRLNVTLGDSSQNQLIIEVTDNGCGMDEKVKNRVFDPFYTTKTPSEGTGLGLSLCYNSIEKLGGHIEVDSELGKGSTFKVTLPGNDKKNRNYTA